MSSARSGYPILKIVNIFLTWNAWSRKCFGTPTPTLRTRHITIANNKMFWNLRWNAPVPLGGFAFDMWHACC